MLQRVIAPLYAVVLERAASMLGNSKQHWDLWPAHTSLTGAWSLLAKETYRNMKDRKVLFTAASSGAWLSPSEATLTSKSERSASF